MVKLSREAQRQSVSRNGGRWLIMLQKETNALRWALAALSIMSLLLIFGCADREELEEAERQQAPGYNAVADEALERAEDAMTEAEVAVDFGELSGLGALADLCTVLPDPLPISQLEKQLKIEEAMAELYTALDALDTSNASLAPARVLTMDDSGVSESDLILIHLHISYCYILAAVSRLARAGIGPDRVHGTADDLYYVSFSGDFVKRRSEIYSFMLTDRGQALMDSVDPNADPYGYIKVFYNEGQIPALQAIIDAVLLLLGAEVAVAENPAAGIRAHGPTINRLIYRHDALYHLVQAVKLARASGSGLENALSRLDEVVTERFSKGILEDAREWRFEMRSVPERYEDLLAR